MSVPAIHEQTCVVCLLPALSGYHPACVLRDVRQANNITNHLPSAACHECPFRKGTVWMTRPWLVLNRMRLKYGRVQSCHQSVATDQGTRQARLTRETHVCTGNVQCLLGGSRDILTPEEFRRLRPARDCDDARAMIRKRAVWSYAGGGRSRR